jgi:hypothetical protein
MSASWSRSDSAEWSYRIISQRLIVVKGKNVNAQNMTVMDELTSLPVAIEVREKDVLESLTVDKEYLAEFKVYTASNIEGVDKQFTDFFEALDIDQKIENFQEAFAVYPTKIRFELTSIEEA